MRTVIQTGSDMATLCVYDRAALPRDIGGALREDRMKVLAACGEEGRLWWVKTGADGSYVVHVYVDEDLPGPVAQHCRDRQEMKRLAVASGRLWVTGAEDVAPDPVPGAPAAGEPECLSVAPGAYALQAWRAVWPESLIAGAMKRRVTEVLGKDGYALRHRRGKRDLISIVTLLASGVFCLGATVAQAGRNFFGWKGLLALWAGWIVAIQVIPRLLAHPETNRAAALERETVLEFPDFVIQLNRLTSAA